MMKNEGKEGRTESTISGIQRFAVVGSNKSPEPERFCEIIKGTVLHKSFCSACFVVN